MQLQIISSGVEKGPGPLRGSTSFDPAKVHYQAQLKSGLGSLGRMKGKNDCVPERQGTPLLSVYKIWDGQLMQQKISVSHIMHNSVLVCPKDWEISVH